MSLRMGFSIILAVALTSILSLSTHVLILNYFNPPVINHDLNSNAMINYVIRLSTTMGAMIIYLLAKESWMNIKPIYRVILFAFLIMALTEQLFRSVIMEIVVGVPLLYQAFSVIPSYVNWICLSLLICLSMLIIQRKNKFSLLRFLLFSVLIAAVTFFIRKFVNDLMAPFLLLIPIDASRIIHPPYGMNVMVPSYITFLEPTIAAFILFYLIRNKLSSFNTIMKGLIIGGILIIIHGGLYSITQIACSLGNIFYRIFYYGQFLWEYLALGILTALSFKIINKKLVKQDFWI